MSPHRRRHALAALAVGVSVVLAGCGSDGSDSEASSAVSSASAVASSAAESTSASAEPADSSDGCGPVRSTEFPDLDAKPLRVLAGDVDCATAESVMNEYLAQPIDGEHGNANVRWINDWSCNMPTAATSEASGMAATCTDQESDQDPKPEIGIPTD